MKRIVVIALMLAACLTVRAQVNGKNEISFSFGTGSYNQVISSVLQTLEEFSQDFGFERSDVASKSSGAWSLEYCRYLGDIEVWGIGLSATFESDHTSIKRDEQLKGPESYDFKFITLMPEVKYRWFERMHLSVYTKVAFGVSLGLEEIDSTKDRMVLPAFQINPCCIDFGGAAFRGFAEIGWGAQSLVALGVRYCF